MTLKERIKSESTLIGKILKNLIGPISTIAALGAYFNMLPQVIMDTIPLWAKHIVLVAGVISFLYGHWTIANPKQGEQV